MLGKTMLLWYYRVVKLKGKDAADQYLRDLTEWVIELSAERASEIMGDAK